MAEVRFKLDPNSQLTSKDIEMINNAKSTGNDHECPPLTKDFLAHCRVIRYKGGKKQIEAITAGEDSGTDK